MQTGYHANMLSCKHVIMQTCFFLSADRVTLKKIKVTNGVAESEPTVYHYPAGVYIKQEDPEIPTFTFDSSINPITAYKINKKITKFTETEEID